MSDFQRELEIALQAVQTAAFACRKVQATITPAKLEKKDRSPVTIADFASQAIVCRALQEAFPDDPVIGEEDSAELRNGEQSQFVDQVVGCVEGEGISCNADEVCDWIDRGSTNDYSARFWTLDPIDGTKGFLRGGQYAVSLALIIDGEIQVGVVGCPNFEHAPNQTGAILSAVRGKGAFVCPLEDLSEQHQIHVSETSEASEATFCESVESGHSSQGTSAAVAESLKITNEPVRMDSQAKYATVATGIADIYMRLPTRKDYREKIWDHAGGVIVVEEAGGTVTDVAGRPLDWTHGHELKENRGVIVTNGNLHARLVETLGSLMD